MHVEFEAKILQVDKDAVRSTLQRLDAKLVHAEFLMRRVVFNPPIATGGAWMRVRQEADKITMSYKQVNGTKIDDQLEVELRVDSFDEAVKFLQSIGAKKKAYQETMRETWYLDSAQITIDTWPGLHPFIEVEGDSEQKVKTVVEKMGYNYSDTCFGAVDIVYKQELGITPEQLNGQTPVISFDHVPSKADYIK
jgi:predicted adenylyl cyclase CyaB